MEGKSKRGFAAMDAARQREIASHGGRAAHAKGAAHQWSRDEARSAGHKGGLAVSQDRDHMSAIGREGGEARSRAMALAAEPRPRRFVDREQVVLLERHAVLAADKSAAGRELEAQDDATV